MKSAESMKIVLFGANGQVGWELRRALQPLGDVVALGHAEADFEQPQALASLIDTQRPQAIVNAAAYTAVDKAESEPERAQCINADAPGVLAEAARRHGAWLVHYSTDYVFDGSGDTPRSEDAPTAPLGVYGRSKLEGEQRIAASGCKHLVFRTSWVYAARGGNFAKTMLRLAAERDRLTVVDDQHGAPTGADLIADVSAHALRSAWRDDGLAGTYHLVAAGETSWHGYARHVIERARAQAWPLKAAADAVLPVPSSAFPTPARRPLNSRLSTERLQRTFGLHLPPWQQGVDRLLDELRA
jgi:dTDP-4-dehydrorhamnose reductase